MRLKDLADQIGHSGQFASIYFDSSHDTADAARQIELRWRAVVDQLEGAGLAQQTLTALDNAVTENPPSQGRAGRALVAAGSTVLIDEQLPEPPPGRIARVSPLPYLLPLIEHDAQQVPHVVAVIDRTGADLRAVGQHGMNQESVQGTEHHVHKVRGGGWSHWSIQNRVEEKSRQNVEEVAREVSRLVDDVDAQVLVLAGEVQARKALYDAIAPRPREIAVEASTGNRATGGDAEAFEHEVRRILDEHVEKQRQASFDRFHAELNRDNGLAAQGLNETLSALNAANVEYLLVNPQVLADRTLCSGAQPTPLATAEQPLRAAGEETVHTVRADEALPIAALATGAMVVTSDEALPDGVGVLLRHT
ncbi:Rv2629 family ribosome hibernation factor [Kibdelosporangium aridum]|uniref:Rv2629 family ribosome hibernation factor n=1 Tax=Kibdelosporangium aridum TaxID=2030 RepID=UPI0035E84E3D